MEAEGLRPQWLHTSTASETTDFSSLLLDISNGSSTLSTNYAELNRILLELVNLEQWAKLVASTFKDPQPSRRPWPYFVDEDNMWQ